MAEEQPTREVLERLVERLEHLEGELRENAARLRAVERRLGIDGRETSPERRRPLYESLTDERQEAAPESPQAARTETRTASPAEEGAQARTTYETRADSEAAQEPRRDLETFVGGSLFAWVGIIAGAIAVALFLKEAFEREWIGPGTRVLLGAAVGSSLLGLGERLRGRGMRQYAFVISGGGILILYLSIYAAFNFYQLVSQPVAFILMALVTTGAVLLSVRLNALAVAVLALIGGFLTPVLLSTGRDNQIALFAYVALLDAGVLAVAYFKRWLSLNFLSFFATVLMTLGWMAIHYEQGKLWRTLLFLTLFFALYTLLSVVHNLLPRRHARWYDVLLMTANAVFYFGISYVLLTDAGRGRVAPAALALTVSALYAGLYYAGRRLSREDLVLAYSYAGAAVTFLTTAAAIRLELHWVTIAWAVEGLMLTWAGLRAREDALRHAGVVVSGFALMHWLGWDMPGFAFAEGEQFTPLVNRRALSCAVLVATLAAGSKLYRRADKVDEGERANINTFFVLAANALALTLLTFDLNDHFRARLARAATDAAEQRRVLENTQEFSISVLWAFYGATALVFGILRRLPLLRYGALLLLLGCAAKVLAVDATFYAAAWHILVFNHTFMAFAVLALALAACVRFYARAGGVGETERAAAPSALLFAAHALALVALSLEAAGHYERAAAALSAQAGAGTPEALRDLKFAQQLSLSVIWALYGGALLVVGRLRRSRLLRVMSLSLLGLTALKVFFWDLASLDRVYRIISFIVLGVILLAVSYLYQKSQRRSEERGDE